MLRVSLWTPLSSLASALLPFTAAGLCSLPGVLPAPLQSALAPRTPTCCLNQGGATHGPHTAGSYCQLSGLILFDFSAAFDTNGCFLASKFLPLFSPRIRHLSDFPYKSLDASFPSLLALLPASKCVLITAVLLLMAALMSTLH